MQRYIARRIALFIPTLLLITVLVFFFLRILPGDPALLLLAGDLGGGTFTQEELDNLRHEMGLDKHITVQYGNWLWDLLRGDLGTAMHFQTEVKDELAVRIPLTLELAFMAGIMSFILAVPLGIISALKQDSLIDYAARIFTFAGISVPTFVVALVTVYLLVRFFNYFPPLGYTTLWEEPLTNLQQLIFPALTLTMFQMNFTARVTRSAMLEVLREDYIRTARAKGLREQRVIFFHAIKNAFLPVVTTAGWAFGVLLGGTIIVEKIFVIPGLGTLLLSSIIKRDYTLITGIILVIGCGVLVVNLLVDLLYGWLDPRIRYV